MKTGLKMVLRPQLFFFLFFSLFYCSFIADGCQELTGFLKHNHNVKALDIGKNYIQDDGAKQLCEILKTFTLCTEHT